MELMTVGSAGWAAGSEADAALDRLQHSLGLPADAPSEAPAAAVRIVSATQDYGRPTRDLCCHTFTPLRVGDTTFRHGIGAHANGRIEVALGVPCRWFSAQVGIDNNADTGGTRGSAVFIVRTDGAEKARTPVCRCGEAARALQVDLTGAKVLELVINAGAAGIAYDQSDWAEAEIETADGEILDLASLLPAGEACPFFEQRPTGFTVDGVINWQRFATWPRQVDGPAAGDGVRTTTVTWTDPDSALAATLTLRRFELGAMELGWRLRNGGDKPSAVISDLASLDLAAPSADHRGVLLSSSGGLTGGFDRGGERVGFELARTLLGSRVLTVADGRSSNGDLPLFSLHEGLSGWGVATALGWSGQWRADTRYDAATHQLRQTVTMQPLHFRLPPGETVDLPTVLVAPYRGDADEGPRRLRRVLRRHYQAHLNGQAAMAPVSFNSWFVFGNNVNAAMLTDLARSAAPLGIEYFCLDAGWFEGGFPDGVGNWTVDRAKFPDGLKAVADAVHGAGMKFGLWFEPERVAPGTRWAREHSDLVIGDLLDLGRTEARKLVIDLISGMVDEVGIDWIRYDFNTGPLAAWARRENAESRGLAQLRHVNGLYAVLDELMRRHPGLLIEQCSSGGRRIDLRTIQRGHTIWKSDETGDQPLMRFHETGANVFLPGSLLNTNLLDIRSPGETAALCAGPLAFGADFRKLNPEQRAWLTKLIAAYKRFRPLLDEDYYPLFAQTPSPAGWNGWQFVSADGRRGVAIAYRQPSSPYPAAEVKLRGLALAPGTYRLTEALSGRVVDVTGQALAAGWTLNLARDETQIWEFARP